MGLSEDFWTVVHKNEDDPENGRIAYKLAFDAPDGPERDALLAISHHEGIGVKPDFEKAFDYAERAAKHDEGLALYLLGIMCDNAETPDQAEGGPRQKYDQYDAETFMERCTKTDSCWAAPAHLWLGHFFYDSARGGDPDIAIEHFEAIGDDDEDAAAILSDHYWDMANRLEFEDQGINDKLYHWTKAAVILRPSDYSMRYATLLAEGIGCKQSFRLARKYYEDAYYFGRWEGAEAIALLYEKRAAETGMNSEEREKRLHEAGLWHKSADELRLKQIAEDPDPAIEED
ncbi:MAG: hypothetical protein Q4C34_09920 [Bacteroidales bacterium]|nr:hypothetical protein [Bacteroidales bacterium]